MKAVKANKVYTIDDTAKSAYLAQGYDIADDSGKVVERSPQTAVKYSEYEKIAAENKKLKAEIAKLKKEEK